MKGILIVFIIIIVCGEVYSQGNTTLVKVYSTKPDGVDSICTINTVYAERQGYVRQDSSLNLENRKYLGVDIYLNGVDFSILKQDGILKSHNNNIVDTSNTAGTNKQLVRNNIDELFGYNDRVFVELPDTQKADSLCITVVPKNKYKEFVIALIPKRRAYYQVRLIAQNTEKCIDTSAIVSLSQSYTSTTKSNDSTFECKKSSRPPTIKFDTLGLNLQMVLVEGGVYIRDTTKLYQRDSIEDFYIGRFEISNKQWNSIMPTDYIGWVCDNGPDYPKTFVKKTEINEFCEKLQNIIGGTVRLPYKIEWEYAAKGGREAQKFVYAGSDSLDIVAWRKGCPHAITDTIKKKPNILDIYGMSGNVSEYCADVYNNNTSDEETYSVIKGGSVNDNQDSYFEINYDDKVKNDNKESYRHWLGFRIIYIPPKKEIKELGDTEK